MSLWIVTLQCKPARLRARVTIHKGGALTDSSLILLEGRVHILEHLRDAHGTGKNALDIFEHGILNAKRPVLIQEIIGTSLERSYHFLSSWIKCGIGDI